MFDAPNGPPEVDQPGTLADGVSDDPPQIPPPPPVPAPAVTLLALAGTPKGDEFQPDPLPIAAPGAFQLEPSAAVFETRREGRMMSSSPSIRAAEPSTLPTAGGGLDRRDVDAEMSASSSGIEGRGRPMGSTGPIGSTRRLAWRNSGVLPSEAWRKGTLAPIGDGAEKAESGIRFAILPLLGNPMPTARPELEVSKPAALPGAASVKGGRLLAPPFGEIGEMPDV